MNWLRSHIAYSSYLWIGFILLFSMAGFLLLSEFRISKILTDGWNPLVLCECASYTAMTGPLANKLTVILAIFSSAVFLWSTLVFIGIFVETIFFSYKINMMPKTKHQKYGIFVLDTDEPIAFTYGLFYRQIAISRFLIEKLSQEDLEAIVEHESYHQQFGDPLKMLVIQWLEATFYFVPGYYHVGLFCKTHIELAADEVIKNPEQLKKALIGHISLQHDYKSGESKAISKFSVTKARLDLLFGSSLRWNQRRLLAGFIMPIILSAVFIVFASSSYQFHLKYLYNDIQCTNSPTACVEQP